MCLRQDVKAKDDTAKVLGETVFKGGVEDTEELQAEDPMLEQPIEDIETINNQMDAGEKTKVTMRNLVIATYRGTWYLVPGTK